MATPFFVFHQPKANISLAHPLSAQKLPHQPSPAILLCGSLPAIIIPNAAQPLPSARDAQIGLKRTRHAAQTGKPPGSAAGRSGRLPQDRLVWHAEFFGFTGAGLPARTG